jgi:integral membrane protein
MDLIKTTVGRFRLIAFVEGVSFLVIIFITMPLKYFADIGGPNKISGMLHGVLFILYILLIFPTGKKLNWNFKTMFIVALASLVPFGTFFIDYKYLKGKS